MQQPALQRQRLIPFRHVLGEIAQQRSGVGLAEAARASRAPRPRQGRKDSIASPNDESSSLRASRRSTVASSSSTISGISRICRCHAVCAPATPSVSHRPIALMRGVLVDHDQSVSGLRHDVGFVDLRPCQRPRDDRSAQSTVASRSVCRRWARRRRRPLAPVRQRPALPSRRMPASGLRVRRRAPPVPIAGPRRERGAEG